MLFTGDLQNCGDCGVVIFQDMSDIIGNVLVDENDADIIAGGKILKGLLNLIKFGVLLDNQKVRRTCCAVSYTGQEKTSDCVLLLERRRSQRKVRGVQQWGSADQKDTEKNSTESDSMFLRNAAREDGILPHRSPRSRPVTASAPWQQ